MSDNVVTLYPESPSTYQNTCPVCSVEHFTMFQWGDSDEGPYKFICTNGHELDGHFIRPDYEGDDVED